MSPVAGVLLTPGAGAGKDHHSLLAVERSLAATVPPVPARRIDFPARAAGRRAPDRAPVAVAHVVSETEAFARELGVSTDRVVIGGRSYGGRMCSMAVADGLPVAGLVLLSYPLHPPGKPESLRVDHFDRLGRVPVLLVSGDRDPFGSPAEFAAHLGAMPGPVHQVWLPGAHDVRGKDEDVAAEVARWVGTLR